MLKKDVFKGELSRRLFSQGINVKVADILTRNEAAEYCGESPNKWTSGITEKPIPDYYSAPGFGQHGMRFYLRSHLKAKSTWQSQNLGWPPDSDEPHGDDLIRYMGGW